MPADSHCHILDPKLFERADDIAANLCAEGIDFIVEISADPTEAREALCFANAHDNVFCTVGVHPIFAAIQQAHQPFQRLHLILCTDFSKFFSSFAKDILVCTDKTNVIQHIKESWDEESSK